MKRRHAIITLPAILLAALFSAHPILFELSREGIASGQYWRLLTGHFVHFTPEHFCANIAAMVLLIHLIPPLRLRQALWLGLWTPLLLAISLLFARPDLASYGGLSGWLAAIFIFVAAAYARRPGTVGHIFRLSIVAFLLKIFIEFTAGTSLFAELGQGIIVEPAAHALGAAVALVGIAFDRTAPNIRPKRKPARLSVSENKRHFPRAVA